MIISRQLHTVVEGTSVFEEGPRSSKVLAKAGAIFVKRCATFCLWHKGLPNRMPETDIACSEEHQLALGVINL